MNYQRAMKVRRTELGMTAQQLADKVGVKVNTIYAYESDSKNKRVPKRDRMKAIADALDTTVYDLFFKGEDN